MDILIGIGIPLGLTVVVVVGMVIYHIGWMTGFKRSSQISQIAREMVEGDKNGRNSL